MKKKHNLLLMILLLSVLFQYCFWDQSLGLNLAVFLTALTASVIALKEKSTFSRQTILYGLFTLLALGCVLATNSMLSKATFIVCFLITAGHMQKPMLKSAYMAAFQQIQSFFTAPVRLANYIEKNTETNWYKPVYYLRLTILPLLIFIVFLTMYMGGNSHFFTFITDNTEALGIYLSELLSHFSFAQIMFFLIGMTIISSILTPDLFEQLVRLDLRSRTDLCRTRAKKVNSIITSPIGLKNELKIATLLIFMLNILLLLVNITDIKWVWLNYSGKQAWELSQYVHQGTWMLIATIFLSMAVILFFFSGNLNFIKGNRNLKILTITWIMQNMLLLISVGLRNYQYIYNFGLAYKRIGVIMFLLGTIAGLITLIVKVQKRKSAIFLLRTNSLCVIIICLVFSIFPWDSVIAYYNISNSKTEYVDTDFLLSLSDKALPVLIQHEEILTAQDWNASQRLYQKIGNFRAKWQNTSWQSWNLADYYTYQALQKQSDN